MCSVTTTAVLVIFMTGNPADCNLRMFETTQSRKIWHNMTECITWSWLFCIFMLMILYHISDYIVLNISVCLSSFCTLPLNSKSVLHLIWVHHKLRRSWPDLLQVMCQPFLWHGNLSHLFWYGLVKKLWWFTNSQGITVGPYIWETLRNHSAWLLL